MDLWPAVDVAIHIAPLVGVGVGIFGVVKGLADLRHLRKDSRSRTRPYVYAEAVPGLQGHGCWDLRITNMGASMARNITISPEGLEEWTPADSDDHIMKELKTALAQSFDLPPGSGVRWMWRMDRMIGKKREVAGAPENTALTIEYRDDQSKRGGKKEHVDNYAIRTDFGNIMPAPAEGKVADGGDERNLKDIAYALRAANLHLGELRR